MNEATIERVAKHLASSNGDPAAWGAYAHQAMIGVELFDVVDATRWETIDTAPRNGIHIYACGGYSDCEGVEPYCPEVWWDDQQEAWRLASYDSGHYGEYDSPTHWRPLPYPPKI